MDGEKAAAGNATIPHKETRAEKEYADFLFASMAPITLLIGMLVCFSLSIPVDINDDQNVACQIAMTDEEVTAIAPHLARILDKLKLSPRTRGFITSSTDYTALLFAVLSYGARIYGLTQTIKETKSNVQTVPTPANPTQQPGGQNGLANFGAFAVA